MTASMSQVTVPTNPATKLCTVPPGAELLISSNETSADVYLGTSSSVTSSNGFILTANSTTHFPNPQTGAPFDVWAIAGTGSHAVGIFLVTAA